MIFKKSYSFIILPHHGEQGKSVFFHSRWLNILLLATVTALGVSGFFITRHYLYHYKLKTAFEPTFKENEVLRKERKKYGQVRDSLAHDIASLQAQLKKERSVYLSSVNGLARELDAVKKLAVKVKIQAGFKTSNIVDEHEAAGGPSGERIYIGWQDISKPIDPGPLEGKVRPGIVEQSQILEEIDDYLSTKESLVSDTPELAPLFGRMTSGFGVRRWRRSGHSENHAGIDIAVPKGTPVLAPAEGVVVYAGWMGDYGRLIELDHGNGYTTRFGHLSQIEVEIGDRALKGQIIGAVGSTGRSTGPHLHYEVRFQGKAIDPIDYLGSMEK
ncbi:M23 family metallopeptidase [candidate division TA06 bacterium]|uniref:M23 family metallopeptidase n=1 Tax=candidate division TA06 bacterium TaxID=2250710 RepID=A0A933I9X6_UNCT6|nr:M23 family metallopeptidase [candidate division TA06 bacterium]